MELGPTHTTRVGQRFNMLTYHLCPTLHSIRKVWQEVWQAARLITMRLYHTYHIYHTYLYIIIEYIYIGDTYIYIGYRVAVWQCGKVWQMPEKLVTMRVSSCHTR